MLPGFSCAASRLSLGFCNRCITWMALQALPGPLGQRKQGIIWPACAMYGLFCRCGSYRRLVFKGIVAETASDMLQQLPCAPSCCCCCFRRVVEAVCLAVSTSLWTCRMSQCLVPCSGSLELLPGSQWLSSALMVLVPSIRFDLRQHCTSACCLCCAHTGHLGQCVTHNPKTQIASGHLYPPI